jgi:hypothetical protein
MERYAESLRRHLGAWGCQVSLLDYDQLADVGRLTFDVPGRNVVEVAVAVKYLGRSERSARVREAIRKHWPSPNRLWPANSNARKLLAKEAHS